MSKVYDPFSYEIDEDQYPTYRWMRDEAPVYHNEEMDFFALTRFSDNLDAFIDKDAYTSTWSTSLEFMDQPHPDSGMPSIELITSIGSRAVNSFTTSNRSRPTSASR